MQLNELIKNARILANLKQEELADRLEVTQSYISQIESGEKHPSALIVLRIEKALNLEQGTLWSVQNILMDRITKNIKSLNPIELNEVDEYLRFIVYRRNNDIAF